MPGSQRMQRAEQGGQHQRHQNGGYRERRQAEQTGQAAGGDHRPWFRFSRRPHRHKSPDPVRDPALPLVRGPVLGTEHHRQVPSISAFTW
ncbi:hypothetical protein [Actinoplanes couchii]|uniref:hypothetical protein n=1 Tax=Actinoplanes couchii TaxID=403638 RepID=UPI00285F1799|nr:hypothetical protein [Actinoplanes couchii]MDR6321142.1 hypothetical protein [Actinoplanes couchii]